MLLFPSRGQEFQNSDPSKQLRFDLSAGDPEAIFGHTSNGNRLEPKQPLLFLECGAHFRRLHSEVNFPAVARAPSYYDSYDLADMALRACQKWLQTQLDFNTFDFAQCRPCQKTHRTAGRATNLFSMDLCRRAKITNFMHFQN